MTKLSSPIGVYSQYEHKNSLMNEIFLYDELQLIKYLEDVMNKRESHASSHNCNDHTSKEPIIWHVRYDHWADDDLSEFRQDVFKLLLKDGEVEDKVSKKEILKRIEGLTKRENA
tara:strand:+ start:42 stop:386 length:345 start_codon:yes stop_codon:yes gene_type:complete